MMTVAEKWRVEQSKITHCKIGKVKTRRNTWVEEFLQKQEPLGREFEKIIEDNLDELYEN